MGGRHRSQVSVEPVQRLADGLRAPHQGVARVHEHESLVPLGRTQQLDEEPATLGIGGLSGVLLAATSMGNPPVIIYFLSGPDSAAVNRANFTGHFAATLAAVLVMMAARGLIDGATVLRTALLLPLFAGAAGVSAAACSAFAISFS